MRFIATSGVTSVVDDENGYVLEGTIPSGGASLPTTASVYAAGCKIVDESTGMSFKNRGTVAVPLWDSEQTTIIVQHSAAQLFALYSAPQVLIAAIPGKMIILDSYEFVITRTATAFANGGVVAPQLASTVHAGGTLLTATIAATVVTGAAGTTYTKRIPVVLSDVASASAKGIGMYLSCATADFDTGTGTAFSKITYHLV